MKTFVRSGAFYLFIFTCALLVGCGNGPQLPPQPPGPAIVNDLVRFGDKITIQLSGVPDGGFFVEKQIPPSGDVTLPYLTQTFHVVGKTTSQVAEEVTDAYKAHNIYTNPIVSVLEEERFIVIGGEVRSPANVPYRADLSLMGAINTSGGFTEFANRKSVRVIRGKDVFYVDCVKAAEVPGADPPVYPGDQIYVLRTVF